MEGLEEMFESLIFALNMNTGSPLRAQADPAESTSEVVVFSSFGLPRSPVVSTMTLDDDQVPSSTFNWMDNWLLFFKDMRGLTHAESVFREDFLAKRSTPVKNLFDD